MSRIRTVAVLAAAAAGVLATPFAASAAVSGPAFYVDGVVYRTVATPTDLSRTGAPAHSYDLIYDLGGAQLNVAEAAPGDTDFNGGRVRDDAKYNAAIAGQTALGRVGEAEDIGPVVAMLLADGSQWINGQRIEASGGMVL